MSQRRESEKTGTLKLPVLQEEHSLAQGTRAAHQFSKYSLCSFFRIKIRRLLSCFHFSNMSVFFNDSLLRNAIGNLKFKNIVYFPMGLN